MRLAAAQATAVTGPVRAAPRRPAAVAAALPRARAARMELEECLSEAEDWVFNTACEGAACWQPDGMEVVPATIGARVELPLALAHGNGHGAGAHSNGSGSGQLESTGSGTKAKHTPQNEGPMDQDALDAWRATSERVATGGKRRVPRGPAVSVGS